MIDDAHVPALFALVVLCLVRLTPDLPAILCAAAVSLAIGGVGWGLGRVTRGARRLALPAPGLALDARAIPLLAAALLIGCRAPTR